MTLQVGDFVVFNSEEENDTFCSIIEVLPGGYKLLFFTGREWGTICIDDERYVVPARRRFLELKIWE